MSEASKAYPREATFTAADGKTYTVRPLTLDGLIAIEERFTLESIEQAFDTERLQLHKSVNLRFLLWIVLRAAHPDLTEEQTGRIIDVQILPAARTAVVQAFTGGLPDADEKREAATPEDPQS